MVTQTVFGSLDGRELPLLTLTDGAVSVDLIPLGAAVRAIRVPDRAGNLLDVCLGYDTPAEYRDRDGALGGTLGRCANRIGGARFTLGGETYHVTANEGANTLHGGAEGFHQKLWDWAAGEDDVTFSLDSPDGDEGFPGNLHAEVTYTLRGGVLTLEYRASCDHDTVVNLSNHTYFNLAGHGVGSVADHRVTLGAGRYTPCGAGNVPTGEIAPVDGTPLDLRRGALLGERLGDPFLARTRGYDHNFALDGGGGGLLPRHRHRPGGAHHPGGDAALHRRLSDGPRREGRGPVWPGRRAVPGDPALPGRGEPPRFPLPRPAEGRDVPGGHLLAVLREMIERSPQAELRLRASLNERCPDNRPPDRRCTA